MKQYGSMDKTRCQLKTMNRQFGFYMDQKTAMKNNLISLLNQTYPWANDFFDSPAHNDGCQKWVDFVHTYWHVDCVRTKSLPAFTDHYHKWCRRKGYHFSAEKAEKIYQISWPVNTKGRIGEVNYNTRGERMVIIAYRSARDMDVQFDDGTIKEHVAYDAFKKGHVRKPKK